MKDVRVLLADDHEVVRTGLRSLIDVTPGMEVVGEARDGADACRRAAELRPDVVVMDVSMPVLDGVEATERLTADFPAVRVVALTMHEDRGHLARLLQTGAAGYVLKRAAANELVRAIEVVAAGGTYVDPVLAGSVLRGASGASALSDREAEVLRRIAWGETNKEIATRLEISVKTVETYKARTGKLGLRSRTEIVRFALQQGWLSEEV